MRPSCTGAMIGGMIQSKILAATVSTVAVVLSGAGAGVASAATVTVDKSCYSTGAVDAERPKVGFMLAGFPAESNIQLNGGIGNGDLGFVTAGPDGGFEGLFPVDALSKGRATYGLTATTFDSTVTASTSYTVAAPGVSMVPAVARPATKVTFKARGFVGGTVLYAHYAITKSEVSHPLVKTVKLGALKGPCGDLDTKRLAQLPVKKPRHKTVYEIQFDTSPTFKRQKGLYIARTVFVP